MEKKKRVRIALFSGGMDNAYNAVLADSFVKKCNSLGNEVVWFQSLCNTYAGLITEIGSENIYNLFNPELFDAVALMTITIKKQKYVDLIVNKAKEYNLPIFSIDKQIEGAYNILMDYEDGVGIIVRHLIEKHGVTEFGFIAGEKGNYASDTRENVFRQVLKEKNIPFDEKWFGYGKFWDEPAAEVVKGWYKEYGRLPRAIVCVNDSMAIGIYNVIYELGLSIPDDVIITGIDGIEESQTMSPSITTAKRDIVGAAKTAAEIIYKLLNEKQPIQNEYKVGTEVLYMQSCGCRGKSDSILENRLRHQMFKNIGSVNNSSEGLSNLAVELTGGFDFRRTVLSLGKFLKKLWTRCSWLCISEDYITNVNELDEIYLPYDNYITDGYCKTMSINVVSTEQDFRPDGTIDFFPPFETMKLLPKLDEILEEYHNLLVVPLHFQDRTIGYIAMEFTQCLGNFYILNTFMCNVSMVLENARIQSELHGFANKLEEMYIRDSMTNLMNRRGFYQSIPKIYEHCIEEKLYFMVISIDLDDLKAINDDYGHCEGDNAIITTAKALFSAAENEILARFGGDEYVVAGVCKHESYGDEFVGKINDFLRNYNEKSDKPYKIHASCGVYKMVPYRGLSIDEFISNADEMMYNEKILSKRHRCASRSRQ